MCKENEIFHSLNWLSWFPSPAWKRLEWKESIKPPKQQTLSLGTAADDQILLWSGFCRESQLSQGGSKQSARSHRWHNKEAKTRDDRCQAMMTASASETVSAADFCWPRSAPHESSVFNSYSSVVPIQFGTWAVQSALSLTRLVLVMRWQACKQSDWFSQQTSEALFPFWLIFHKLTLAATQSWCKGRLRFWLFVIYHTLAGWLHSVSVMENRPESTEHLLESGIK